jgi:AAA domain, putative AbiEii toxin, Type IV TA system/AAA ATPase domain
LDRVEHHVDRPVLEDGDERDTIRSLNLRDFKSFHDVEVPLGPFTLVVGTNASGKSNLRDALRFLHGVGLGFTIAEIFGEKYGPGGVLQWRGIRGGLPEAARQGTTHFDILAEVLLGPKLVLFGSGADIFVEDGSIRAHFGAHIFDTPGHTKVASILSSLRFLDLDPDAMRIPSNPGQAVLGDRGENLSSVLHAICKDPSRKTSLLEWVRALTPLDAADLTFESDFTGRILLHLVEAGGAKLSAASVSDGTLRFLAMVAALLSEDTGKIYVFEELDNGIHPTRLHLLLELIDRACAEQGVQVIATSHNPAMLAFLGERARADALLIYRGEDHTSHVRRVMDLPNIAEILRTQDLSRLMLSGWLEDAAAFSEPDPAPEASEGTP